MRINKLALYNFNSYEGLNEFDFTSGDPSKNIILIGGKNGAGKTSLFIAIKIALYGPLAFGYVGVNPHYIAKIKDCINAKAFQKHTVQSSVQITISLTVEREIKEYEITREWDYTRQKLEEKYYVKEGEKLLDEQKLSYFQNYLQGLVPPDLFEFFLFDGEEVGSIFSTRSYNAYVRNATYTLCGLDIFEIIRKYTVGYAGKAANKEEEDLHRLYDELRKKEKNISKKKAELEEQVTLEQELLELTETELIEIETAFKNAGGITDSERQMLSEEYEKVEYTKTEATAKIKKFVEGLMPFFIVKDTAKKIAAQLKCEEKSEIYHYVKQKINKKEIKAILGEENINDETVDSLMEFLVNKFKPVGFAEGIEPIHDLSKEDVGRVDAVITSLDNFDVHAMVGVVNQRKSSADRMMEINKILKSAMNDDDAAMFTEKEEVLCSKKDEIAANIDISQSQIDLLTNELAEIKQQRDKVFQKLKASTQNRHVFELSLGLSRMMDSLLTDKMASIKQKLEKLIVANLQHIYRKNNLISYIEIDKDFQFNLYQNATYSTIELVHLMCNLGGEAFSVEVGEVGLKRLFEIYKVNSLSLLQKSMLNTPLGEEIELYKRIDISRLSKGERQIFILSLYWAIIELSGQEIPFVIDTPYARIDANHRKEISEKFFPNISKQVIILSTDEEINEEYYKIIQPHIAKEFLLINEESQNRTTIERHYFFEV